MICLDNVDSLIISNCNGDSWIIKNVVLENDEDDDNNIVYDNR